MLIRRQPFNKADARETARFYPVLPEPSWRSACHVELDAETGRSRRETLIWFWDDDDITGHRVRLDHSSGLVTIWTLRDATDKRSLVAPDFVRLVRNVFRRKTEPVEPVLDALRELFPETESTIVALLEKCP